MKQRQYKSLSLMVLNFAANCTDSPSQRISYWTANYGLWTWMPGREAWTWRTFPLSVLIMQPLASRSYWNIFNNFLAASAKPTWPRWWTEARILSNRSGWEMGGKRDWTILKVLSLQLPGAYWFSEKISSDWRGYLNDRCLVTYRNNMK